MFLCFLLFYFIDCEFSFVLLFTIRFSVLFTYYFLMFLSFVVTTTTSRAVTVSTRGCTYRLPGSFRQFPLRGSNYADPADIQMLRLVLGSPAGGLSINGSDGRSLLSSRPEDACAFTPARVSRLPIVVLVGWITLQRFKGHGVTLTLSFRGCRHKIFL